MKKEIKPNDDYTEIEIPELALLAILALVCTILVLAVVGGYALYVGAVSI